MHNNRIYDRGTAALGRALLENNCLEFLSLGSNGVGDEGAKGLAEGLRGNSMLRRLDLYLNLIGDEGAAALADALKLNKGLRMLHLDTNRIEEAGGLALAEAVRGTPVGLLGGRGAPPSLLGELGLMYNPLGSLAVEALIAAAKANPTIHALGLDHASGVKGAAAHALEHEHQPRMHDRHRLAHFLVEQRLVMNEGFSDAQLWESQLDRPLADRKRGHGGWHSAFHGWSASSASCSLRSNPRTILDITRTAVVCPPLPDTDTSLLHLDTYRSTRVILSNDSASRTSLNGVVGRGCADTLFC
jgi:hypothetical protein